MSLESWADLGMLDREMAVYRKLSEICREVNMITYGEKRDREIGSDFPGINILTARWLDNPNKVARRLLLKYFPKIYRTDILKTNQILGSEIPVWLKKKLGKKLVVRCGYLFSYMTRKQTDDENVIDAAVTLEKNAFESADIGIVTTSWQRDLVVDNYNVDPDKIRVIPNYVVTDVFSPDPSARKHFDLVFVGRPDEQKNIGGLLEALKYLKREKRGVSLLMVGSCCDDKAIRERVERDGLDVTFMGNVPNFQLPELLNQGRVFILPSFYEGHPKVLLEAMSCGLACIGSDVDGIGLDIDNGKTGYLCKTDPESIASAISAVLADIPLRKALGESARDYVMANYSLEKVLELETGVLKEVLTR